VAVPLTLKVFKGDQLVASKGFDRDIIKIGRLASAHLTLEDEKVARIHAVLDVSPDGSLSVTDMGTSEGTLLNGKRVMKSPVQYGDMLLLGGTTIVIEKGGAVEETAVAAAVAAPGAGTRTPMAVATPEIVPAQAKKPVAVPPPFAPAPDGVSQSAGGGGQDEATGDAARARPRRRKGSGPLGVELRFMWGDSIVGEFFLPPEREQVFRVGSDPACHFAMGDSRFAGASFELLRMEKGSATLRYSSKMTGELHRRGGDEVIALEAARKSGAAQPDGDALAIALATDDFAWVDLGGVVVEVFFQPCPKPVFVPFTDTVDFTALNIFLMMFFLASLFVISAANREAEGDEFADDLNASNARMAKLLIRPPEAQKNPILERFEKKREAGEMAAKHKGGEGQMGKQEAPKRSAHAAPKGDPNNKDQARMLVAKVFGGSGGGISTVFGHQGLGGELKSAMGGMFGAAAGDAQGFGGLGLRGSGSGGGGVGDSIGIGGVNTKGRGGGIGGYGSGVGGLGKARADVDVAITQSDPTVIGSLDKELIRKVIHSNRGQIRYCYESQLNRFPKLNGKVAVKFVISSQGTVASSSVAQSTVNNAELEACVAGRVRTWVFPKPKGGGVVVVTYPFIFQQSGQ
jgi:TonB family protein